MDEFETEQRAQLNAAAASGDWLAVRDERDTFARLCAQHVTMGDPFGRVELWARLFDYANSLITARIAELVTR